MDYYDPRRRALRAATASCSTRAECPFCGRVLGDVARLPGLRRCSWQTLRRTAGHPAGPGAEHYMQQSGRCSCALPLQRPVSAARHPERKVSGQAVGGLWRWATDLVQPGSLAVRSDRAATASCCPQPVPWAGHRVTTCIVPVPASGKKRGYNVPELMALPLAQAMERAGGHRRHWTRTRATRHQAGLAAGTSGMANVAGAFRAAQPQAAGGQAHPVWWTTS